MHDEELRSALAALLDGLPPSRATAAVERLISEYRGRTTTDTPVLRDRADAVAYAAYRMPATFAAVSAALAEFRARLPEWGPRRHVDVGGGTGAAGWAVAAAWPGGVHTTVLDWSESALGIGRELAARALPDVEWRRERIGPALALPPTDLVTISYVLGELTEGDRAAAVDAAGTAARAVLVIEPGTPEGYMRVMAARDRLVGAGFTVLAPCPHSDRCPMVPGEDWCHFAARVSRSSLHRRVKGGSLGHEDEKYSYVAAVRPDPAEDAGPHEQGHALSGTPAQGRIVRRPQIRKGQVLLELCTDREGLARRTVTKRDRTAYRAARDAAWGDSWPPPEEGPKGEGPEGEGPADDRP
ncbi:small ribosomal subunit Rsm22 family protein [Streptomyces alkaliterrae]|uniref:rRNA methyltransferase n=2 Tax=Streptomyces alkaliterrae TaxID=2213162 RepID=A0A7W3WT91_9ACTN|nr:small ribosomal subunit Rsm22 family protein [Streptomyces alkaliterrae]MBB1257870.1 rRNA methyltransferase [Streptomyces alkaliterrae]